MKKDQKHINYTAHDIERYNTGKMSTQEMHELEKAALEDSFLADAIEGYTHTTSSDADMTYLKHNLQQTITKRRGKHISRIPGQWLRVAALLIFLVGAGWLIYLFSLNDTESVAQENKPALERNLQKQSTSSSEADANSGVSNLQADTQSVAITRKTGNSADQLKRESNSSYARQSRSVTSNKQDEIANTATGVSTAPAIAKDNDGNQSRLARQSKVDSLANVFEIRSTRGQATRKNSIVEPNSGTIRGQVVNTKGEALPNASVRINNSQPGTLTDKQGYFTVPVKDSSVVATVSYVGYEANRVRLKNVDSINRIVLKESNASLSEVVVTSYSGRRKREISSENNKALPEPIGGWLVFEEYISKNLKNDSKIKGEVQLSFNINKQGVPEKIKVEIPLCNKCDREAIRLLKQGPKWKRVDDSRGRAVIVF